jgi:DMSO/TMAO reductase YedYZ molybdopterin-dependent catalytic subunit
MRLKDAACRCLVKVAAGAHPAPVERVAGSKPLVAAAAGRHARATVSDEKKIRPLSERKQAFAERQIARQKGLFSGMTPQGSGPPNRHGMPTLPVGQRAVTHWPVLDLGGDVPDFDDASWTLTVDGLVEQPTTYSFEQLLQLPQTEDTSDFHCVTGWSRMDNHWKGVRFADLAAAAGVRDSAHHVLIEAHDRDSGSDLPYTTNLSLEEAMQPDVMLVHTWEGAPLPPEHGGPLRMITPQLYAWKGAKWIKRIRFAEHDEPGFWEVRGYSNTALPWYDDRFSRR